jgi:hypothetical protein
MMVEFKPIPLKLLACVVVLASTISACSQSGHNQMATPKGTVSLENLKVGTRENVFKNAILTFYEDRNPAASVDNKTQYNSRTYNAKGGQYLAQCRGDKCFELQVYYTSNPISKEEALETLKQMLPEGAPPQTRVDSSQMNTSSPTEYYYFGDYRGELVYADKSADKVKIVNAVDMKGEASGGRQLSTTSTQAQQ